MKFYTKKKRTPAVAIVSLIDILAILLIFFIVTTTFKKDQPVLKIELPESKAAEAAPAEQKPILLDVKSEEEITLDNESVPLDGLAEALRKRITNEPDRPVAMRADREASFGTIVQVLDAMRHAGLENTPAFTQPGNTEATQTP